MSRILCRHGNCVTKHRKPITSKTTHIIEERELVFGVSVMTQYRFDGA